MKFIVVLDANSPIGGFLMNRFKQFGGASDAVQCGFTSHPLVYCSAIDWGSTPDFVRLTHIQNPPDETTARELVVPRRCIVFSVPTPPQTPGEAAVGLGPSIKH